MNNNITRILVASGNKGKLKEISVLLGNIGVEAISASDYSLIEPEESGKNFVENAIIKAKYYGNKTGFISLADDSGLCIEELNGDPGIYSARWAINKKTGEKDFSIAFSEIKQLLLDKGIDISLKKPKAYFICSLALYNPRNNQINTFEGRVDGYLSFPPNGDKGFGYDPIFIMNGMDKTFAQIDPQEKEKISHRSKAFQGLVNFLGK